MRFRLSPPACAAWVLPLFLTAGAASAQDAFGPLPGMVESSPPDARGGMLGTFYPTPYMTVGGNGDAGYTPLQQYGAGTLSLYGPFSSLRPITSETRVTTRGYRGVAQSRPAIVVTYPFLPSVTAPLYPRRVQVRGAGPVQTTPPWWDTGHYWVDYE